MIGWIKLHRKIIDWEWFAEPNMAHLFVYFLLMANTSEKHWQGHLIKRGELITSLNHLERETGVTKDRIRTILKKLEKTGEIKRAAESNYTRIKIVNYDFYQDKEPQKSNL